MSETLGTAAVGRSRRGALQAGDAADAASPACGLPKRLRPMTVAPRVLLIAYAPFAAAALVAETMPADVPLPASRFTTAVFIALPTFWP